MCFLCFFKKTWPMRSKATEITDDPYNNLLCIGAGIWYQGYSFTNNLTVSMMYSVNDFSFIS